jgi:hypothetical protein
VAEDQRGAVGQIGLEQAGAEQGRERGDRQGQ